MLFLALTAALAGPTQVAMAPMCAGPDAAIVAVNPFPPTRDGFAVLHFRVAVTVKNIGSRRQAFNTLDSVVMFQQDEKTDVKGLQPLRVGQSQTVIFNFKRAAGTQRGSTNLRFHVTGSPDCNPANDTASINI
jgi:hypothetical protein